MKENFVLKNMFRRFAFVCLMIPVYQHALASDVGGLAFKSSDELINQRTSARFDISDIGFRGSFSFTFNLSIWHPDKFGYIFSYVLPSNKVINLVHVHFRNNNNSQLELTIPSENKAAIIVVPKKQLGKSQWLPITVNFNNEGSLVTVLCNDKLIKLSTSLMNETKNGVLYFGRSDHNIDVVRMAIRNIDITQKSGNKSVNIPLNQKESMKIFDNNRNYVGDVENPSWLISDHLHWEAIGNTICQYNSGIAYDSKRNEISIFSLDSIINYSFEKQSFETSFFKNKTSIEKFYREAIYATSTDNSLVYHYGNAEIGDYVITRTNNQSVEKYFKIKESIGKKHHHAAIFNEIDSSLYCFGGYGSFSYYNKLTKLSLNNSSWIDIPLHGDTITPRFFTTMAQGPKVNEVFVFGGFGNPSGKQEMGGFHLFDLFKVNLKTGDCKKLADFNSQIQENFVALNQMIYFEKQQELYVLGFTHQKVNAKLQLYRISLKDYTIKSVADNIPMMSEKIQSSAFLYFDENNSQLICVVKEWMKETEAKLKIYTLASPPLNEDEVVDIKGRSNYILLIALAGGMTLLFIIYFYFSVRKNKGKKKAHSDATDENVHDQADEDKCLTKVTKTNSIVTFGGFVVFDKSGKDITYRFSVRLKHFFTLLLLNTYSEREGLTSQEICSILWPDKDLSSAQNLRGVTANQLRAVLSDIEGIVMEKSQSGKWTIRINQPAFCDYIFVINVLSQSKSLDVTTLLQILSNGTFFPLIQTNWIDKFKSNFESLILELLPKEIPLMVERSEWSNLVKLMAVLLIYEPLNDEYIAIKLSALLKLGKTSSATQAYENYKFEYKKSYGNAISYDLRVFIDKHSKVKI